MENISFYFIPALQIIWIDLLLSGDNAVVIALASRNLPPDLRKKVVFYGAAFAIGLRIIFTVLTNFLLDMPWIKAIGAVLLIWVAVKLLVSEEEDTSNIKPADNLRQAIQTIAIADLVMSLDNVLAIAASAKGSVGLIIFGLLASIPLVIAGSQLILKVLHRYPILVWAGAALLGWVAGEIFSHDVGITKTLGWHIPNITIASFTVNIAPIIGTIIVLILGYFVTRKKVKLSNTL
jgi:YjbE family integral membrane protein